MNNLAKTISTYQLKCLGYFTRSFYQLAQYHPCGGDFVNAFVNVMIQKRGGPTLAMQPKQIGAQVAMLGVFDSGKTGSVIWILAFVCATMYQLWWGVFLEWELFEWITGNGTLGGSFHLRKQRLYQRKSLYIFIFVVNTILRFVWAMLVMPTRYLSPSGTLLNTFLADFPTLIAPVLECAEIFRRSLWVLMTCSSPRRAVRSHSLVCSEKYF